MTFTIKDYVSAGRLMSLSIAVLSGWPARGLLSMA